MALLRSCCCFTNVRTGSFASGIYTLILALINGGLMGFNLHAVAVSNDATVPDDPGEVPEEFQDINITLDDTALPVDVGPLSHLYGWLYTTLALCALQFLASVLLIVAIHTDKRQLVLPWLAVMGCMIVLDTAVLIYQCIGSGLLTFNIIQMVIWLALTMLNIYCILCVVSQYQELKAGRGTLEYIRQEQAAVLYRAGALQQVHISQGPIIMGPNGRVITMATTPLINAGNFRGPTLTSQITSPSTTLIARPPDYSIAASCVPRYSAGTTNPGRPRRTHLESIAAGKVPTYWTVSEVEDDQQADSLLLDEEKELERGKHSPPPPYSP